MRRSESIGTNIRGKIKKVKFEFVAEPEATYNPIEKDLSDKIRSVAKKPGLSSDTLVNLWIEQKIKEQKSRRKNGRKLAAKQAQGLIRRQVI